jgi:hypothetical protein
VVGWDKVTGIPATEKLKTLGIEVKESVRRPRFQIGNRVSIMRLNREKI